MSERYICAGCDWTGSKEDLLSAPHPFDDGATLYGCPSCLDISILQACDVDGCTMYASCGTPTAEGYRRTCWKHQPEVDK